MMGNSVDVKEMTTAILAMLESTLQEAVAGAPGSGWEIVINLGPPLPNGDRDWDTKITRRNRYKYKRPVN